MQKHQIEQFIQGNQLIAISYKTAKNPEVVHPRVKAEAGQLFVYGRTRDDSKLRNIEINEFLRLLARATPGLAVGGNREGGSGAQTSISFSKQEQLTIDPAFQRLLAAYQ